MGTGFAILDMEHVADSANISLSKPLHEIVRENIGNWQAIGANQVILDWIDQGVLFPLTSEIPNFFHTQITHEDTALDYWHTTLKPHYLASGAMR